MPFVPFYKIRQNRSCKGKGKAVGKRCGMVNIVQILCTHVCGWKNDTYSNYSRNWERGRIEENGGGDESKYEIFDVL
jgi:hypothetical protein